MKASICGTAQKLEVILKLFDILPASLEELEIEIDSPEISISEKIKKFKMLKVLTIKFFNQKDLFYDSLIPNIPESVEVLTIDALKLKKSMGSKFNRLVRLRKLEMCGCIQDQDFIQELISAIYPFIEDLKLRINTDNNNIITDLSKCKKLKRISIIGCMPRIFKAKFISNPMMFSMRYVTIFNHEALTDETEQIEKMALERARERFTNTEIVI